MSGPRRDKHLLFQAISVMGKAFASPVRLELLDLLAQAPRSVEALARATGQSNANVSQHLQALHAAGMVTRERQGTSVRYEIAGPDALRLWVALRDASIMRLAVTRDAACYSPAVIDKHVSTVLEIAGIVTQVRKMREEKRD